MQGWIKLHRKIIESPVFNDPDLLRLWVICLSKASHKATTIVLDRQQIQLLPGEFVTGRKSLLDEYNRVLKPKKKITESTLWRTLKFLEELGNLNIKSTNKYSVISIVKWCEYQEIEQQLNNKWTTDEQQVNTNKNVKKEKNVKEKEYIPLEDMDHVKITQADFDKLVTLLGDKEKVMDKLYSFASWILGQSAKKQQTASAYLSIVNWHKRDLAKPLTPIISKSRTSIPTSPKEFVPEGDLLEWVKAANAHVRN